MKVKMRLRGIVIVGAILSITVGFVLGRTVVANSPAPGSNADPVVSKSYVDKAMQDRVGDLEKKVAELMVQAQALQSTINEVQSKNIKTSSTSTPPSTTPEKPEKPEKPATQEKPDSEITPEKPAQGSVIGKTAYINTQSTVNLRSAPTTEASIIGKVTKDDTLLIQKEENKWYSVKLKDDTVGWIAGWLVTVK